jgi:hypothetical protein
MSGPEQRVVHSSVGDDLVRDDGHDRREHQDDQRPRNQPPRCFRRLRTVSLPGRVSVFGGSYREITRQRQAVLDDHHA